MEFLKFPLFSVFDYVRNLKTSEPLIDLLVKEKSQEDVKSSLFHYPPHLKLSLIQAGLKSGKYLQGKFHASRENYLEASISVEGQDNSVSIFAFACVGFAKAPSH